MSNQQDGSSPGIPTINHILASTIKRIISILNLGKDKSEHIEKALSHLKDITKVYPQSEDQLYQATVNELEAVDLLEFQSTQLLEQLIEKYFKMLTLFKESYEVAELQSKQDKYKRLQVDQPEIKLTLPLPYICPPLIEAKQMREAKIVAFQDEEEDTVERFN